MVTLTDFKMVKIFKTVDLVHNGLRFVEFSLKLPNYCTCNLVKIMFGVEGCVTIIFSVLRVSSRAALMTCKHRWPGRGEGKTGIMPRAPNRWGRRTRVQCDVLCFSQSWISCHENFALIKTSGKHYSELLLTFSHMVHRRTPHLQWVLHSQLKKEWGHTDFDFLTAPLSYENMTR